MKRKNGFTLVELLAVIIILVVITLIATPIVLNVVDKARMSAAESSIAGYADTAKLARLEYLFANQTEELYDLSTLDIVNSGEKVSCEKVVYTKECGIVLKKCSLKDNDNTYYYYNNKVYYEESSELDDLCAVKSSGDITEEESLEPNLASNMIPVMWYQNNWVKADIANEDGIFYWYDYDRQMWANAVTVIEGSRDTYKNATIGTVVNMSDILTMMVWIPRFEYRYDNLETSYAGGSQTQPGGIEINLISASKVTPTDAYRIHPGFTFGSEELSGFWISKFETTGSYSSACTNETCMTANITSKPDISTISGQSLSSYWYGIRSMQRNGNQYGYNSNVDIHLIKNSEWGAVAYLSQSKYGKYGNSDYSGVNKEIYLNNSVIAGNDSGVPSGNTSSISCDYNGTSNRGNGTGSCGSGASTTGTIYGVYDMVGGRYDYVMGNYNNTLGSSGFTSMPDRKYYDLYTTTNANTACNGSVCYGHALSETTGWYGDTIAFLTSTNPWLGRGSVHSSMTEIAGIFSTFYFTGNPIKVSVETGRIVHK